MNIGVSRCTLDFLRRMYFTVSAVLGAWRLLLLISRAAFIVLDSVCFWSEMGVL